MIRRWLNIISFVGLLLSVGLWIRSHLVLDSLKFPLATPNSYFAASSMLGVCSIGTVVGPDLASPDGMTLHCSDAEQFRQARQQAKEIFEEVARKRGRPKPLEFMPIKSFQWRSGSFMLNGQARGGTSVSFPHWLIALAFTVPLWKPGWLIVRKHRRAHLGLCLGCGYSLQGLTEPRCPECARPFGKPV